MEEVEKREEGAMRGNKWVLVLIFVLLVAVRIPFYMTHHIQEDAFVRSANICSHSPLSWQ